MRPCTSGWYNSDVNVEVRKPLDVSVIILTWNSQTFAEKCLTSVFREIRDIAAEVIVVDNASRDNTVPLIQTKFPSVTLIQNKENRGVAPARNQGLRQARGRYALILDVDAEMTPGSLKELLNFMEKHSDVGLCGPKLLYPDGKLQYSCRKFPTLQYKIFRRLPFKWAERWLEDEELRTWDHETSIPVDYVIGACQLIRSQALAAVGLLDERMFYGPEDVDLCLRLWLHGWKVYYVPQAVVIHWEQRVTKKLLSRITWYHFVALWRYFAKHGYYLSRKKIYGKIKLQQKAGRKCVREEH